MASLKRGELGRKEFPDWGSGHAFSALALISSGGKRTILTMESRFALPAEQRRQATVDEWDRQKLDLVRYQLDQAESILIKTGHLDVVDWLAELYARVARANQAIREIQAKLG
jgi:hypothetical protein